MSLNHISPQENPEASPQTSHKIITIDGPSGSGKGTLAAKLAVHYGFALLDSGALYRLLGLAAHRLGLLDQSPLDVAALANLARGLDIAFVPDEQQNLAVLLDGADVSTAIRSEQAGIHASQVAALGDVRAALLQRQHDFAGQRGLVADGRDMGTVVFPHAPVKIYLTASAEARAERRYKQLQNRGVTADYGQILADLQERDRRDTERTVAPLRPAEDALMIDCSAMGIDAVFAQMTAYADAKFILLQATSG